MHLVVDVAKFFDWNLRHHSEVQDGEGDVIVPKNVAAGLIAAAGEAGRFNFDHVLFERIAPDRVRAVVSDGPTLLVVEWGDMDAGDFRVVMSAATLKARLKAHTRKTPVGVTEFDNSPDVRFPPWEAVVPGDNDPQAVVVGLCPAHAAKLFNAASKVLDDGLVNVSVRLKGNVVVSGKAGDVTVRGVICSMQPEAE